MFKLVIFDHKAPLFSRIDRWEINLGDWFIKCPLAEPTCPACRTEWRYKGDVAYLKKKATEREEERMRIEAIERETGQTTNQVPPTNFVAVTRPQGRIARLCSFLTPRRRSRRRVAPSGGKRRRRKKTRKKKRKTKRKKRKRRKKKSRRRRK